MLTCPQAVFNLVSLSPPPPHHSLSPTEFSPTATSLCPTISSGGSLSRSFVVRPDVAVQPRNGSYFVQGNVADDQRLFNFSHRPCDDVLLVTARILCRRGVLEIQYARDGLPTINLNISYGTDVITLSVYAFSVWDLIL